MMIKALMMSQLMSQVTLGEEPDLSTDYTNQEAHYDEFQNMLIESAENSASEQFDTLLMFVVAAVLITVLIVLFTVKTAHKKNKRYW